MMNEMENKALKMEEMDKVNGGDLMDIVDGAIQVGINVTNAVVNGFTSATEWMVDLLFH